MPGDEFSPGTCPILSTPASKDAKGRTIPAATQECLGTLCKLYNQDSGVCELFAIPGALEEARSAGSGLKELMNLIAHTSRSSEESVRKTLGDSEDQIRGVLRDYKRLRAELSSETAKTAEEREQISRLLRSVRETVGTAVDALDGEVRRLKEDTRLARAREAFSDGARDLKAGNLAAGEKKLRSAIRELGPTPELLNALGCACTRLGNLGEAEKQLRRCLEADPEFAPAHVNLALVLTRQRRLDEAETAVREGLRLSSGSAAAWNTLGNLLFLSGRRTEAMEAWHRAVRNDPGRTEAWENLRRQQVAGHCPYEALIEEAPTWELPPVPPPEELESEAPSAPLTVFEMVAPSPPRETPSESSEFMDPDDAPTLEASVSLDDLDEPLK